MFIVHFCRQLKGKYLPMHTQNISQNIHGKHERLKDWYISYQLN